MVTYLFLSSELSLAVDDTLGIDNVIRRAQNLLPAFPDLLIFMAGNDNRFGLCSMQARLIEEDPAVYLYAHLWRKSMPKHEWEILRNRKRRRIGLRQR